MPNVADPVQAMRDALEHPLDYPALRLALTPEDHIAIVVDESIPQLDRLLVPLLEHITQAQVQPEAITLICPPPSGGQAWLDELPDVFQDVKVEVHQPGDRRKLAYLATTKADRRVYLNRTFVDADQTVVLTRRSYDPLVGYAGGATALYPWLSDQATLDEYRTEFDREPPGVEAWPVQEEANEVAWLSGAPFFVQVIDGDGDGIARILAGPRESSGAVQKMLDDRWRIEVGQLADVVLASITGSHFAPRPTSGEGPGVRGPTIEDMARALFAAARVVKPGGSIVLLTDLTPTLGPSFERFRQHDDPALALRLVTEEKPSDLAAGFMWATAAEQAKLYLLSGLAPDVAEELYTIPLQHPGQAQRLLTEHATCVLLPDAHKTLAVLR